MMTVGGDPKQLIQLQVEKRSPELGTGRLLESNRSGCVGEGAERSREATVHPCLENTSPDSALHGCSLVGIFLSKSAKPELC